MARKLPIDNREQQVKIRGHLSSPMRITTGVPEGSVLGPILFIISFNDIFQNISSLPIKLVLYADDATCIVENRSLSEAIDITKIALDEFHVWFTANELKQNESKTKYMVFTK